MSVSITKGPILWYATRKRDWISQGAAVKKNWPVLVALIGRESYPQWPPWAYVFTSRGWVVRK